MNRASALVRLLIPLLPALGACAIPAATGEAPARPHALAPRAARSPAREAAAPARVPEAAAAEPAAAPRARRSDATELELWNDPAFKRRFVESYAAETDVEPRISAPEREIVLQFQQRMEADDAAGALALVESQGESGNALFDYLVGCIHFDREELEQAIAAFEAAVEKHPKFRRAWENLGMTHVRLGEFAEAARALTRVIELGGGSALTYGLLGYSRSSLGDDLAAESAYRLASMLDPSSNDWKMGLARSFFRQKRFPDAIALCGALIESAPERADLWLLQASAYLGTGQPERAAENYELVERMGQATPESLETLGDIYVNQKLYDLAVSCYVRAMEKAPGARPERALRAAKVLTAGGALEASASLLERITALHQEHLTEGDQKDVLKLRARLAVARGEGDEEARVLEEIVALDPLDGEALILLGQHAERMNEPERAEFYYQRAEGLEAFEADAKVRHAQLLVKQRRYAEALPLLRSAQNLNPRENVQKYLEDVERFAQAR